MVEGFSSADPSLARGEQISATEYTRRHKNHKSHKSSYKTVKINGGEVFINGVGYSVAPSLQEKFIRDKTGGRGSSASAAIKAAIAAEEARKAAQEKQRIDKERRQKLISSRDIKQDMSAQQFQEMLQREAQKNLTPEQRKAQDKLFNNQQKKFNKKFIPKGKKQYYLPSGEIVTPTYGLGAGGTQTTVGTYQHSKLDLLDIGRSIESAAVPSLTLERTMYLPTKEDKGKYLELLEKSKYNPIYRYKLDRFLSQKEKELKFDKRKAEAFNTKIEQNNKNIEKLNKEASKINRLILEGKKVKDTSVFDKLGELNKKAKSFSEDPVFNKLRYAQVASGGREGQFGTGWETALAGAKIYKKQDKKVHIPLVGDVSGKSALIGLKAGTEAYKAERDVLLFDIGTAGLGALGFAAPTITGSAKAKKILKITSGISASSLGLGFGALSGVTEYKKTGDVGLALGAGFGTTTGFLTGVYSKEIFETGGNLGKWVKQNIHAPTIKPLEEISIKGKKGGTVIGKKSKLAELQLKKYKAKKAAMTEEQAINEFKARYRLRSEQIRVIESSIKNKVYLNKQDFIKDLRKWKVFLKKAGLSEVEISDRLAEVVLRQNLRETLNERMAGLITDKEYQLKINKIKEAIVKLRAKTAKKITSTAIQQEQIPTTLVSERQITGQISKQKTRQIPKLKSMQLSRQAFNIGLVSGLVSIQSTKQRKRQETKQAMLLDSLTSTKTLTRQVSKIRQGELIGKNQIAENMMSSLIGARGISTYKSISPSKPKMRETGFGFGWDFDKPKPKPRKPKPKKLKKKKKKYIAQITGFEAALGLGPRYIKAGTRFTGFEAIRGKSIRKPLKKKIKKKPVKKKPKKRIKNMIDFLY